LVAAARAVKEKVAAVVEVVTAELPPGMPQSILAVPSSGEGITGPYKTVLKVDEQAILVRLIFAWL
jgi:hypothetical protein